MTTTGYGFQIDMTDRATHAGAVIREVPIVFRDRTAGESKMSSAIIREALLMVTRRAFATGTGPAADRRTHPADRRHRTLRRSSWSWPIRAPEPA